MSGPWVACQALSKSSSAWGGLVGAVCPAWSSWLSPWQEVHMRTSPGWKVIQYRLGPQHFKGLALYLAMTRTLAPANIDDQALVNIMRWESVGSGAQPTM